MVSEGEVRTILLSVEERVGTVTLNRPEKLNAFTVEMAEEIAGALRHLSADDAVRAIVVTGAGRAFCAGADVTLLQDLMQRRDRATGTRLVDAAREVAHAIREAPQPVLASVNGAAAGGGANLCLACDLRIASDRASIGQVFSRIGLHPDWGGTYYLPRLVGPAKALELFTSGAMVDAAEAYRLGLFNCVVPAEKLALETARWARDLAAAPPLAVARAKRAVHQSLDATLDEMLDYELEAQLACFESDDAREGLAAFLEKREPIFRGR